MFTLEIIPPGKPAETRITKILDFVIWLSEFVSIEAFASDQYQCLTEETLIPTDRGIISIKELVIGDTVFSHTGACKVTKTYKYDNAPLVEVRTKRGHTMRGTPTHKHVVETRGEIRNEMLRITHPQKRNKSL